MKHFLLVCAFAGTCSAAMVSSTQCLRGGVLLSEDPEHCEFVLQDQSGWYYSAAWASAYDTGDGGFQLSVLARADNVAAFPPVADADVMEARAFASNSQVLTFDGTGPAILRVSVQLENNAYALGQGSIKIGSRSETFSAPYCTFCIDPITYEFQIQRGEEVPFEVSLSSASGIRIIPENAGIIFRLIGMTVIPAPADPVATPEPSTAIIGLGLLVAGCKRTWSSAASDTRSEAL